MVILGYRGVDRKGGIPKLTIYVWLSFPRSSTNLTELAKAARLLAALNPSQPTGDELLKAAKALAAATAELLNSAQPENMKVGQEEGVGGVGGGTYILVIGDYISLTCLV